MKIEVRGSSGKGKGKEQDGHFLLGFSISWNIPQASQVPKTTFWNIISSGKRSRRRGSLCDCKSGWWQERRRELAGPREIRSVGWELDFLSEPSFEHRGTHSKAEIAATLLTEICAFENVLPKFQCSLPAPSRSWDILYSPFMLTPR